MGNGLDEINALLGLSGDDGFKEMPSSVTTQKRQKSGFPEIDQETSDELFGLLGVKPQGKWDPLGSVAQVGKLVYDIPTQTRGAIGSLAESFDDNPLSKIDWKDQWQKDAEARTQQRQQELADSGNATGRLLPGTDFIQRKDIADAGASTGFSLVSMAPSVAGTALKAIPYVGPALGIAAGMAGSGTLAYKMDKNTFTRQLLDKANADMQKTSGREMNPAEIDSLLKSTEDIRNDHAMWEAGPEAVGNALTVYGLGKVFDGASGGGLKKIIGGLLADVGGEVATETVTQTGQHNAEVDAGISDEPRRSFLSPGDWAQSFKEVAPQTIVLSGLLGGGSAVAGKVYDRYRGAGNGQNTDTQGGNLTQPADALSQRADAAATPTVQSHTIRRHDLRRRQPGQPHLHHGHAWARWVRARFCSSWE